LSWILLGRASDSKGNQDEQHQRVFFHSGRSGL
jgi:hypothetical protein